MKILILVVCLLNPVSGSSLAQTNQIIGTWRLVSFARTIVATGEKIEAFGKSPSGYIEFGSEGRMMMIIVSENRVNPADPLKMTDKDRADLFRTMRAYAGTYTFDGETLISHLDVSWNQTWSGMEQRRHIEINGRRLIISADPHQSDFDGNGVTGVMTFEKIP